MSQQFKDLAIEPVRAETLPDGPEICLVYGDTGTGKTEFMLSAGDRTLFINNGGGIKTLHAPGFIQRHGKVNPLVINIAEKFDRRGKVEIPEAHDMMCDSLDRMLMSSKRDEFDLVCIDDSTALGRSAIWKAIDVNGDLELSNTEKRIKDKFGIAYPVMPDYNMQMNILKQFFATYTQMCRDAGKHLIIGAHVRYTYTKAAKSEMGLGTLSKVTPAFTGVDRDPNWVTQYFDNVFLFERVGGKFRIRCNPDDIHMAKNRHSGIIPDQVVNPTWNNFIKAVTTKTPLKAN